VSWIILASVAIAVVATVYPAIQAARLYPLEAIRHE
jgi:ABC-type lipoprotein release transport system permease subunit